MQTYKVAIYPGDGIGSEVMDQALRLLERVEAASGFRTEQLHLDWGIRRWERIGELAPPDMLDILRHQDAILVGAVGWPAKVPDHLTLAPLVTIRQRFEQYACIRPTRLLPGVRSVLADKGPEHIDFVVLRENSEGEYVDSGSRFQVGELTEVALQTSIHTRRGVDRILRFGFEMARKRRRQLTMVTKSNALKYGYVLWDECLERIAEEYPDVQANKMHADAAAMNMVRWPERFDVIVASNLFGDLLTDLAGIIGGGLGLAPSTNTNPERRYPSMFEPVHGSAPDIAGQGIANPTAMFLSTALMLDWLGEGDAAARINRAVEQALADGCRTPDLGGDLGTSAMADAVLARLE